MNVPVKSPVLRAELVGLSLRWKHTGTGWRLFDGRRRCYGEIIPDSKYPGMWRTVLSGGRLGDTANATWAKHAVLEAAVRDLTYAARRTAATDPRKCPVNGGVSDAAAPPIAPIEPAATESCVDWPAEPEEAAS